MPVTEDSSPWVVYEWKPNSWLWLRIVRQVGYDELQVDRRDGQGYRSASPQEYWRSIFLELDHLGEAETKRRGLWPKVPKPKQGA